jgi:putative ABC transport system permease protein
MSFLKIAWRSIQRRWLASLLTMLSMALGVALVVSVLLIMGVVAESFRSNSSLGYNMIVGAKGGKLQLVLNTVYHLSTPVENVPYSFYEEFLPPELRSDKQEGKYSKLTEFAIPLCLGDYFLGFRVIGTTPKMFDDFVYDAQRQRKYEFAEGRNFRTWTPEHGYFESVLGAKVAKVSGLKVGDTFSPTHGVDGGEHDSFFVVGILKPSGTPNDRGAFVNMEGFYLLDQHAKPLPSGVDPDAVVPGVPVPDASQADVSLLDEQRRNLKPLPLAQREVTSILIRTVNSLVSRGMQSTINDPEGNDGQFAQAVMPIAEIYSLFRTIVTPIQSVLLLITVMICIVSGVSILVSIYNSMSDRRHEIAIMRALGAGRRAVMSIVLLESILLSLLGGLGGWVLAHLLIGGLASPFVEDRTGVSIGIFDFSPQVRPFESLGNSPIMNWGVSSEFLLIPGLLILAILVGFLPALAAYRTDVSRALD